MPGCLLACQHFQDLQVSCFPQAKTSQANRCLNKYTTTLEYRVLVLIKQTTAGLQGRPWKVTRTKPLFLPSKQNKVQDLDFPENSIPWAAMLPQLHRGRPICQATPPSSPNRQAKYGPTKWQLLLPWAEVLPHHVHLLGEIQVPSRAGKLILKYLSITADLHSGDIQAVLSSDSKSTNKLKFLRQLFQPIPPFHHPKKLIGVFIYASKYIPLSTDHCL